MFELEYSDSDIAGELYNKIIFIENIRKKEYTLPADITQTVYDSVSIEGNSLTVRDITEYLKNGVTVRGKSVRDYLQVRNYSMALEQLKTIVLDPHITLSVEFIKKIHRIVTEGEIEEAGILRDDFVHIRGADFVPPAPDIVAALLNRLIYNYNDIHFDADKTKLEKICDFKRNFERIHPFFDGNGRTGRIIMNILLLQNGYPYLNFPAEEREEYFYSLENGTFLEYAVKCIIRTVEKEKGILYDDRSGTDEREASGR